MKKQQYWFKEDIRFRNATSVEKVLLRPLGSLNPQLQNRIINFNSYLKRAKEKPVLVLLVQNSSVIKAYVSYIL